MAVQSVERALDILSVFSMEHPSLGLSEISRTLGLAKPTAHALINTMKNRGFLDQDPVTKKYCLGIRAFVLGSMFTFTSEIYQKALRKAHEVEAQTGMIVRMGVWDNDAVITILERTPNFTQITPPRQIGPRLKAYCTALGRVFLSFFPEDVAENYLDSVELIPLTPLTKTSKDEILKDLSENRKRGYVLNNREVSMDHSSLAFPIYNGSGEVAAAISLTGDPERINSEEREKLVRVLSHAAEDISISLGHSLTSLATV